MPRQSILCLALCATFLVSPAIAAEKNASSPAAWDVSAPHGKTRKASFRTDEGTWMDLDVSPDGKRIAFSLLGDL